MKQGFFLGNELIAHAAKSVGVSTLYAYPGTPSSEILTCFSEISPNSYTQWSLNEKLALELASAAAISGSTSLCCMKQVGLNVASDPLFSVAYTGVTGGLVVVSADDPGPHSSQTEQDSRMYAYSAKIPVLDPSSPIDAYKLTKKAYKISKEFETMVMLRPVMRVCHSRQNVTVSDDEVSFVHGSFSKDISRWAATPKYRSILHNKLMEKLKEIAKSEEFEILPKNKYAIVASGYPYAICKDVLEQYNDFDLIKIDMPYPLSDKLVEDITNGYEKILVLEETFPLIERAFKDRKKVYGKDTSTVASAGEFTIDICIEAIDKFLNIQSRKSEVYKPIGLLPPVPRPRLCAGCGHRSAFYAIKRAAHNAILPGDIGCYTLGTNLKAVDTCICMGASITFAESLKRENPNKPVVCTIGDSTFFHTGISALLNAKINNAPIVVAILDNETTAMTGFQPVPHANSDISLEKVIGGLGVAFIQVTDAYKINDTSKLIEQAILFAESNKTPAVVIIKKDCVTKGKVVKHTPPIVTDRCNNCGVCYNSFECPAIFVENSRAKIDEELCIGCNQCVDVCMRRCIVCR